MHPQNQMYDEHKESEAIARKERDRERDSVAPKEFTGETAKEFEEELKELQTQWKENAPERKAKAVRQRMHIQKRYDYDETKDELAEIGGGTLQAVIDQQRVSISKAKAALDETDSELHAAKAEERTLQVLVATWTGINMNKRCTYTYAYVSTDLFIYVYNLSIYI